MTTNLVDVLIPAAEAPIGVQLWPTTHERYAPNFTLAAVTVGEHVTWTYQNGTERHFHLGESVACRLEAN